MHSDGENCGSTFTFTMRMKKAEAGQNADNPDDAGLYMLNETNRSESMSLLSG